MSQVVGLWVLKYTKDIGGDAKWQKEES